MDQQQVKSVVDIMVEELLVKDQFDRSAMIARFDNRGGKAALALWYAQERLAELHNRRFVPLGSGGIYVLADEARRVKRVNTRRKAAGRIVERQLHEIRRIDTQALADKERRSLDRIEQSLSDLSVRMKIRQRQAQKKKPAGL